MKLPARGVLALASGVASPVLLALGVMLGGIDPGADSVALVVLAYLAAVAALLLGFIGLLQGSHRALAAAGCAIGALMLALLAGVLPFAVPR